MTQEEVSQIVTDNAYTRGGCRGQLAAPPLPQKLSQNLIFTLIFETNYVDLFQG